MTTQDIKQMVAHLRSVPDSILYTIARIRQELTTNGLSPEDIGETDKSLAELGALLAEPDQVQGRAAAECS